MVIGPASALAGILEFTDSAAYLSAVDNLVSSRRAARIDEGFDV